MASTSTSSCVYTGDHPFKVLLVLPIIDETYDVYGAISSTLASEGKQMGDFDEIIAAITIQ